MLRSDCSPKLLDIYKFKLCWIMLIMTKTGETLFRWFGHLLNPVLLMT